MLDVHSEGMEYSSSYCNTPKPLITSIADFESLGETRLPQGFNGEQKNDSDSEVSSDINSLDEDEPEFFEPEDLLQLGSSAAEAAGKVASAVGSGLHVVKTKWAENAVWKRVVNASGSAFACTMGNGWNTLSEAAEFWASEVDAEESAYLASFRETDSVKELDQATSYSIYTQDSKNVLDTDGSLKKKKSEVPAYDKVKLAPCSVKELTLLAESVNKPPPEMTKIAITDTPSTSAIDECGPAIPPLKLHSSSAPVDKVISRPAPLERTHTSQSKSSTASSSTAAAAASTILSTVEASTLAPASPFSALPHEDIGVTPISTGTVKTPEDAVVEDKAIIRNNSWLYLAAVDVIDEAPITDESFGDWECI